MGKWCIRSGATVPVSLEQLIKGRIVCPSCGREVAVSRIGHEGSQRLGRLSRHGSTATEMQAIINEISISYELTDEYDANAVARRVLEALQARRKTAGPETPWGRLGPIVVRVGAPTRVVPKEVDADVRHIEDAVIAGEAWRSRAGR